MTHPTIARLRAYATREAEVLAALRQSRHVSMFWLSDPLTRWAALARMEKRGEVTVKCDGFPMYRVTIHRKQKGTTK